jgi:rhodanese-related sulfurtransferase
MVMSISQILLYAAVALVLLVSLRRFLITRSVTQYSPDRAAERLREGSVFLDVRTAGERAAHHIKGSLHIPLQTLTTRMDELQRYREREIICYCQTGSRSVLAAARLRKHGYQTANLAGGIVEWNFHERSGGR